ncbi:hypothetical protein AB6805_32440, partial [Chitinophaga sp. RCC_12]|uniref:hypothetical protein n=1 Tax=Chitinophaga sp. RCC_12 TaxID=3239226 RepID=UPI0035269E8D
QGSRIGRCGWNTSFLELIILRAVVSFLLNLFAANANGYTPDAKHISSFNFLLSQVGYGLNRLVR